MELISFLHYLILYETGTKNEESRYEITYEYVDYKIIIYATTELAPSDEDYEGIDIAITELMSSHPDIKEQNINIEKFNGIIGEISPHSGFIFLRKLN